MKNLAYLLAPMLLLACGDDDDEPTIDASSGADVIELWDAAFDATGGADAAIDAAPEFDAPPAAPFALTSTAVQEGAMLPNEYTCETQNSGGNISPPLAWTAGPEGTKSYAVVFTDLDNGSNGFVHSAIFDIPPGVLSLPEDVSKVFQPAEVAGAKQSLAYDEDTNGYLGPCPGSATHTYQFKLYALDVATLPGANANSKSEDLVSVIEEHDLASATLSVESD